MSLTKKIFLGIFIALAAGVFWLWFSATYLPWEDRARERVFNQRLEEKIAAGEEKIYLRDLTDFEWEKLYVMSTEYTHRALEETIGFKYRGNVSSVWCDPGNKADLIFVYQHEATVITLPQCQIMHNCKHLSGKEGYKCSADSLLEVIPYPNYSRQKNYKLILKGE